MERLLAEEAQHWGPSLFLSSWRRGFGTLQMGSTNLIRQLVEMGFPQHWCIEVLSETRNNVDGALTCILTNGGHLSAADEEGHDDEDGNVNYSKDEEKDGNNDDDEEESIAENNDQRIEGQSLSGKKNKSLSRNFDWKPWLGGNMPCTFCLGLFKYKSQNARNYRTA
jgi:hypothetical protein